METKYLPGKFTRVSLPCFPVIKVSIVMVFVKGVYDQVRGENELVI